MGWQPSNEPVRLQCSATGIDIGGGYGLYISAQDNDLNVDKINHAREPQLGLPLPSPREVTAARIAFRLGFESNYV